MKKIFANILLSIFIVSCNKTAPVSGTVIRARAEQTKTEFSPRDGDRYHVLWQAGDVINVNGSDSSPLVSGGSTVADFSFSASLSAPFHAVYPAGAVSGISAGQATLNLLPEQNCVSGKYDPRAAIMVASGNSKDMTLRHLMSYVNVMILGDANISAVEFASRKDAVKVSGEFVTDYNTMWAVNGSHKVRIAPEHALALPASFTFAVPSQYYEEGFEIRIFSDDLRSMSKISPAGVTLDPAIFIPTTVDYQPEAWPEKLYIAGDAVSWGWNPSDPNAVLNKTDDGVYKMHDVAIDAQKGFKLYGSVDWYPEYGVATSASKGNVCFDFAALIGGDPQFKLADLGYESSNYDITVDFKTKKVEFSKPSKYPYTSLSDYLGKYRNRGAMLGMQMPTIHGIQNQYGATWYNSSTYDYSDMKGVVGSNPALCGWEIGHIELQHEANLDGDRFDVLRNHIVAAYVRGAVNTISWHCNNPVNGGGYYSSCDRAIARILPGGDKHNFFVAWMSKAADFILSLKTADGTQVPIIFRPWHEHTDTAKGSGFWWSIGNNSIDEYKALWQMTYDYFVNQRGITNMLWAFSPDLHHLCWYDEWKNDKKAYMNAWPGDAYVDILGLDAYETPWSNFAEKSAEVAGYVSSLAVQKGKFFAITETGFANNNPNHQKYGNNIEWWTKKLYPLTRNLKASYVMVWRNDSFPDGSGQYPEYYSPYPGCYSENDFRNYVSKSDILMESDL